MISLPSMKKTTILLFALQFIALVMLYSIYHLDSNTKYRYALDDIAASLQSEDFQIPPMSKKGTVARQANDICLDSEGVYRPCNDDDYESQVSADRLVTVNPEYLDWDDAKEVPKDDRKNRFSEKKKEYLDGSSRFFYKSNGNKEYAIRQFSGSLSKKNISRKVQNADRLVTLNLEYPDWDDAKEEPKDDRKNSFSEEKKEYLDGSSRFFYKSNGNKEYAIRQFSGSRLKKNISRKVQNADKRFVSDQRMLFSEVYEQVDIQEDVDLLVIVSSGAKKRARRDSIRGTWWTECSQNAKVKILYNL